MADRTSAGVFSDVFDVLADGEVTEDRKRLAARIWRLTDQYDFSQCEMGCDESLIKLGLAEDGEDGAVYKGDSDFKGD